MNNPHQNSRTTFHRRVLIVQRFLKEGKSLRKVAEALGVSRRTVYKWLARYRQSGQDTLYDRSSRLYRSPRRLPVGRVATIAAMRRMPHELLADIFFSFHTSCTRISQKRSEKK